MKKFSPSELSELRNAIPVATLIKDILPVPAKISDGVFHFLCPICKSVHGIERHVSMLCRRTFLFHFARDLT